MTTANCHIICDSIQSYDTVLILNLAHLRHNRSIEAEAICDHHVDLPLAVLLSDALVGGQPRHGGLQRGQAVAGGQADVKQLTRLLRPTQGPNRVTVMRDRKRRLLCPKDLWIMIQMHPIIKNRFELRFNIHF